MARQPSPHSASERTLFGYMSQLSGKRFSSSQITGTHKKIIRKLLFKLLLPGEWENFDPSYFVSAASNSIVLTWEYAKEIAWDVCCNARPQVPPLDSLVPPVWSGAQEPAFEGVLAVTDHALRNSRVSVKASDGQERRNLSVS